MFEVLFVFVLYSVDPSTKENVIEVEQSNVKLVAESCIT